MLETRRINPIAQVTGGVIILLFAFEALVIFGGFELNAQTVAKYAPWAYEPFLHLIGEHPESATRWVPVDEAKEESLEPAGIAEGSSTNETPVVIPAEPKSVVPEMIPTHTPAAKPEEFIPVG